MDSVVEKLSENEKTAADIVEYAEKQKAEIEHLIQNERDVFDRETEQATQEELSRIRAQAKEKMDAVMEEQREKNQKLLEELEGSRFKARERFLRAILEAGSLDYTYASKELGASISVLDFFEKKGLIKIESQEMYRIPKNSGLVKEDGELSLNQEQQEAVAEIFQEWQKPEPRPALLFGVTGSGKT